MRIEGEYGPFDPEHAAALRAWLHKWCQGPELWIELGAYDVCEAVMPALDAMLDLYSETNERADEPTGAKGTA